MRTQSLPLVSFLLVAIFTFNTTGAATAQQPKPAATSSGDNSEHLVDYPKIGVDIGNGWNSLTDKKSSAVCVRFEQKTDNGQDTREDLTSITDQYSLMNEMHVSAEAEIKALGATASTKVEFATKTKINNEYSNFVVRAVVENGAHFIIPEKDTGIIGLTPMALKLAQTDPIRFQQVCGDTFVSSLHGGAELDAVITFTTRSQEDHESLETSFSGSGWGVEAKAAVGSTVETLRKNGQMKIAYMQSGGAGDPIPTDQDKLNDLISNLPKSAANNPKYFQFGLTRYDSLPDWPGNSSGWNETAYQDIGSQYFKLNTLYIQSALILANQNNYIFGDKPVANGAITVAQFKKVSDQLLGLTKDIKERAQKCFASNGKDCNLPPNDRISDYTFRARMPVAHGSQIELDLKKAQADIDAATAVVNSVEAEINAVPYCAASIDFPLPPCPALKLKFVVAVNSKILATAKLTQLQTTYPARLKAAIARTWLESVNASRCIRDVLDSGCISNAQLDIYIATINTPGKSDTAAVPQPPTGLTGTVQ
jgi:hypothetical protein